MLMSIENRVSILGSEFKHSRIVEKILVTITERFEATITNLENTKDLSKITLAELLNSLQAQEQRRVMREEGILVSKHENSGGYKKKNNKKNQPKNEEGAARYSNKSKAGSFKGNYPACKHCGKNGLVSYKCWKRPDAKCSKCNQLGHEAIICKNKLQQQHAYSHVANQQEGDQLFLASCFASNASTEAWLIDSGCTNHMTHYKELFKDLKPIGVTKVRIGHRGYIPAKGMGTITIKTQSEAGFERQLTAPYTPEQNGVKRDKLDKKAAPGIFIGYSNVSKVYNIFQPEGNSEKLIDEFKQDMTQTLEMSDLRLMTYFLGMKITQGKYEFFVCQKKYTKEILKKFKMEKCKEISTPMNQKEKLSKDDRAEKGDETYVRSFIGKPKELCDISKEPSPMESSFRRVNLGCKKQDIIAQSTVEAEFVAAAAAVNQALLLKKILVDLHMEPTGGIKVFVDNEEAIAISNNLVFHGRTKHFKIKFFYLREVQKDGDIALVYCKSEEQLADIFTKPLPVRNGSKGKEKSSRRVADQFRKAVMYRPMIQNARMQKARH
ncbi:uncharacterized protein LOC125819827 [Solanum verrucosum]|uniref:uncharacterized protein LOC125819827 n=1 Tax=Solanum verrucosum TaxID=315347 RepID=UPI0020D1CC58|nr:uncharacterized protein LOC125819827 [Solanum verrucosum]